MDVVFGPGFFTRESTSFPPREVLNLYPERADAREDRAFVLRRTPGFVTYATVADLAIRSLGYESGVLDDKIFGLSGDTFFSVDTSGTVAEINTSVDGFEFTQMAFSRNGQINFASGGLVYHYDGSTFTELDVDSSKNFRSVFFLRGRFYAIPDNSDEFNYSDILDGSTFPALSVLTAEQRGDNLKAGVVFRDEAWLFGSNTIEVWSTTDNANAPLAPLQGVVIQKGLASSTAAVVADQSLYWVGDDLRIYRANGYQADPISTEPISEVLEALTNEEVDGIVAFEYAEAGHQFVVWNIPDNPALVYDATVGEWHRRQSGGVDGYRPVNHIFRSNSHYVGDVATGIIRELGSTYKDEAGEALTRRADLYVPVRQSTACFNFIVDCLTGVGDETTTNPTLQISWSDDQGRQFASPKQVSIGVGAQGQYATRPAARRLGRMVPPGRIFRLEYASPTEFALYGARINEVSP